MSAAIRSMILIAAAMCAACGDRQASRQISDQPPPSQAGEDAAASREGIVTFKVDGRTKRFTNLPAGGNTYLPLAATIKARPAAGATEELGINFILMDLRKFDYPIVLPVSKAAANPTNPMAAMASVGFIYVDDQGKEWAGPGRIQVDSFGTDGVLAGTFSEISLPHTDGELPDVVLTDGNVRAQIGAP